MPNPANPPITPEQLAAYYAELKDEVKTPPEWAEHFGITGLVEDQWQEWGTIRKPNSYSYLSDERPAWERAMTKRDFIDLLHSDYIMDDTRYGTQAASRFRPKHSRAKKIPRVAFTVDEIIEVITGFGKWMGTADIVLHLARSKDLPYALNDLPKGWATKIATLMRADDRIVEFEDTRPTHADHQGPRYRGSGNYWATVEQVEQWREHRDWFETEHPRREELLLRFREAYESFDIGDTSYIKDDKPRFDRTDRTGSVRISWHAFEKFLVETGFVDKSYEFEMPDFDKVAEETDISDLGEE